MSKSDRNMQQQRETPKQSLYATRVRIYPRTVHGRVRTAKWAILIACLAVYYILPWIRWHRGQGQPDQAVLLDISAERFYFFGLELWPQDMWVLAGLMIMGAVTLFLVTSIVGRVWCGYACPQTVWTDLFMWVERAIEGDRAERMARDAAPLTADTIWKKALKHWIWLGIAFWTGGAWIMYFTDAPTVVVDFWTLQAPMPVYFFTGLFTLTTYLLAGWAREQVCTYMCPWPRFQSAMLDDQSITVTYQAWRGEPRRRGRNRGPSQDMAGSQAKAGDCVDCGVCVQACPTGIDIRDGIQLECINCGLCMDACDTVMKRINRPTGLITWDTLAGQKAKEAGRHEALKLFRARTMIYVGVLSLAAVVLLGSLVGRATVNLSVQRDRAPLFVRAPDGSLRNGFTVKVVNKAALNRVFNLRIEGLPGAKLANASGNAQPETTLPILAPADQVETVRVLVTARPARLEDGSIPVTFVLRDTASGVETVYHSIFMGPPGYGAGPQAGTHP
ncbi:cytochrome c oxidase accessory protein CcoG [Rhodopila sp.]|uniref:cytochrome c oxidase accessory protein CcoG n=1 Tax=Rhodopila sp. TaxID=2480087 RepID=UPI002B615088|nr:cytochrome c oxidase accessory protein CcoG [Rhodopila sp.]HVZ08156.1 cytochrome c oxidase accessory protein CcoG [Rhodopila sp.]